jgi:predicted MFS family arabinose efflux permease
MGAYRATIALAPSDDRAGIIAAIYIVSYLATGIPAVIGGVATSHYGLHKTALVYAVVVAALAAVAASLLIRRMASGRAVSGIQHADAPPGPGTVPPCPPIKPRPGEAKA